MRRIRIASMAMLHGVTNLPMPKSILYVLNRHCNRMLFLLDFASLSTAGSPSSDGTADTFIILPI